MTMKALSVVAISCMLLAACATKGDKEAEKETAKPGEAQQQPEEIREPATQAPGKATPLDQRGTIEGDPLTSPESPLNDPESPLSDKVIYFAFDESEVKPKYMDLIAAHGDFLVDHSSLKVRLEGHTDERGTREYNMALGERRAKSVAQILKLQGVSSAQIEVVSYGEELPAAKGSNESAWAKNRRVEIVYEKK